MEKPFKILCIDGGGIKGLFSAQVLAEFEEAFGTTTWCVAPQQVE